MCYVYLFITDCEQVWFIRNQDSDLGIDAHDDFFFFFLLSTSTTQDDFFGLKSRGQHSIWNTIGV